MRKSARITLLLLLASMLYAQSALAQSYQWNRPGQQRGYQEPVMKYNPHQNKWSHERPDSQMKYNPHENKWQYADPQAKPRYNPFENKWDLK